MAISDYLFSKFRDGNLHNRHRALGLKGNDSLVAYYKEKLGSTVTGSLNDLMDKYWKSYVRTGSVTIVTAQSVDDPLVNTVASLGSTTSLIGITRVIGANESAVVNYVYQDIGYKLGDIEYSLDGGASWSLVPTKPFTTSFTPTVAPTSRTMTITGLTNDVLYSLSLRGVSYSTPTESFVPAAAPMPVRPNVSAVPDAPTNLTVTKTQTTATVGFDLPASGTSAITNYQYSLNDGTTWSNVASFNLYGATVSGLTAGTTYSISVRAVNAVGSGTASSSISVTTDGTSAASTPAFRSATYATSTTGSITTSIPTGTVSGDILVLAFWSQYDGKNGGLPGTTPSGWTQRLYVDGPTGDYIAFTFAVYTKTAGASEPSAVLSGGSNWRSGMTAMISVSGATSVDAVGSVGSGLVAPSITSTSATDLLVGIWGVYEGGSGVSEITLPTSMTVRSQQIYSPFAQWELGVATQTLSASGATGTRIATETNGGSALYTGTNCQNSVLLAIK